MGMPAMMTAQVGREHMADMVRKSENFEVMAQMKALDEAWGMIEESSSSGKGASIMRSSSRS